MSRDIREVVAEVDALRTVEDADLDRLQTLIDEYFAFPSADHHIEVWFRLFERFPDDDGCEVFWTILHGLETQPSYDAAVVASVRRKPTHFPVLMVNRMLNGGVVTVDGIDLLELLQEVAADKTAAAIVRKDAQRFAERQRTRAKTVADEAPPGS